MGVSNSAISRVTGVDVSFKNFNKGSAAMLPQRLAIIGQGNDDATYSLSKYECEASAADVANKYGYGSPLHLMALQLFPKAGTSASFPVTIYPIQKGNSDAAATGSITATGTATAAGSGTITIGGIEVDFSVAKGETAADLMTAIIAAINAVLEVPVTAGAITDNSIPLTAKWSGALGNKITLSCDYSAPGITIAITAFANGSGVPSVTTALAGINQVWETFVLNSLGYEDSDTLDDFQTWGESRWNVLEKKPALVCTGCTDAYSTRTAITDLRKNDYINFLVVSVGSPELPFVVAAKALVSDIMTIADSNPPQNYKGSLSGLAAGDDSAQENYTVRNMSVTKGSSTNIKTGSVAELNDVITMYHPDSEGKYPSKRYVVDLVKLMNVVYNVRLITESDEVRGAPLVTDATVTTNATALQPKTFKGWFATLADSLAKAAIIQEPKFTKENMSVAIDSENPKRVNTSFPVKLSGNAEVVSTDLFFGFYVGE